MVEQDDVVMAELTGCELPASSDDPDACLVLPPYDAEWDLEGDQLTFTAPQGPYHLSLVPWARVGS